MENQFLDFSITGATIRIYNGDFEDAANDGVAPEDVLSGVVGIGPNIFAMALDPTAHPVTFEQAVRPLMRFIGHNHHPHTSAIDYCRRAELIEGLSTVITDDYIRD